MVSTRTRAQRSTFAWAAFANNELFKPSTAADPHRVVSFINVVGSGTDWSNPIRQKLPPRDRVRHLPAQRLVSELVAELEEHQPQVGLHRRRRPPQPGVEERLERLEEHRVIQEGVHPGQLHRQPPKFLRQDRLPQRRLVSYRT